MKKILGIVALVALLTVTTLPGSAIKAEAKPGHNLRQKVFVHWPKEGKGGKPPKPPKPPAGPTCEATGSDQVDHWQWAGWQMPEGGVSYQINLGTAPKGIRAQIESVIASASATWTDADVDKQFNYNGETNTRTARYDGQNTIAWKGLDPSAIAITYVWYWADTGELAEVDLMFNKNLPWAVNDPSLGDCEGDPNAYDVQDIATHEFGHWVGLDDLYGSEESELTMYGYGALGELKKNSLGVGDQLGVLAIMP